MVLPGSLGTVNVIVSPSLPERLTQPPVPASSYWNHRYVSLSPSGSEEPAALSVTVLPG
jgi:hypothetical protein